jgi:hypothetical protein
MPDKIELTLEEFDLIYEAIRMPTTKFEERTWSTSSGPNAAPGCSSSRSGIRLACARRPLVTASSRLRRTRSIRRDDVWVGEVPLKRPQCHDGANGPLRSSRWSEALAGRTRERLLTTRQFSSPVAGAVLARTEEFLALG